MLLLRQRYCTEAVFKEQPGVCFQIIKKWNYGLRLNGTASSHRQAVLFALVYGMTHRDERSELLGSFYRMLSN
jgi:hypothetical protein